MDHFEQVGQIMSCPANYLWANAYMASPRRCAGHDSVPDFLLDVVQHIDTLIPY